MSRCAFLCFGPNRHGCFSGYNNITSCRCHGCGLSRRSHAVLRHAQRALGPPEERDDVKQGCIAYKIAAHAADVALGIPATRDFTALIKKVKPFLVINCAEADWNDTVYKACLKNKVHVIDLGSDIPMTKKQLAMDSVFRKQKLIAITGCGSTPGINNIMLDYAVGLLDSVNTVNAGFAWNSNIKEFVVPFSMPSIVEEFTVPATLMKNGRWLKKKPLDTIKGRRYQEIGRNKCFLVRHPEPYTFHFYYKDKGLKKYKIFCWIPDPLFFHDL